MADGLREPDLVDLMELGAVALQGALRPLASGRPGSGPTGPGRTRPVIFVHGWGGARSQWLPLIGFLGLRGFDRLSACDLDPRSPFPLQAAALADHVEALARRCRIGRGSVDLVAHGTGGLVARQYVQGHGGSRRVDRLITLGTPHRGTLSPFWTATPLAGTLLPNSDFILALNADGSQAAVRHASIWSERDLLVAPSQNAINPHGEEVLVPGVGHHAMLIHLQAMREIATRLAEGQALPTGRLGRARNLAGRALRGLFGRPAADPPTQKFPSR